MIEDLTFSWLVLPAYDYSGFLAQQFFEVFGGVGNIFLYDSLIWQVEVELHELILVVGEYFSGAEAAPK
mgnify:FL=1